ncbi:potassium voltage-gated channel protein Shaker-like [Octopus sinensis]|uniref:Potassium voltage-gated channel protein Shaker-like n=1 Tax=Octopus sinensis TaxID=2607531 RepID=A0A6P7U382_9MOLL|nr:potassium voltage-gated channel protein Shaker-like [Octopus sinensis]
MLDIISINISGRKFELDKCYFKKFPKTLLGNPLKLNEYFDKTRNEYFFDRHRDSFEGIINYYQNEGNLKKPGNVDIDIFTREVEFFEIDRRSIENMYADEGIGPYYVPKEINIPENFFLRFIWITLKFPDLSMSGKIIQIFSNLLILLSIANLCLRTYPHNDIRIESLSKINYIFAIEVLFTTYFTIEMIIRLFLIYKIISECFSGKFIVDILSISPLYIQTIFEVIYAHGLIKHSILYTINQICLIIQIIRIFKLSNNLTGLEILGKAIFYSLDCLTLMLVYFMITILFYSSLIYYAELTNVNSNFLSIPDAFWWAIITMTTVGYGDKRPLGVYGKIVAGFCSLSGILIISFPIPVIVSKFTFLYKKKFKMPSEISHETLHDTSTPLMPNLFTGSAEATVRARGQIAKTVGVWGGQM